MLFNSLEFLLFLALVLALYGRLLHAGQNRMLLAASYLFYGWWDWRFLGLLWLSTVTDYTCGLRMQRAASDKIRKRWLWLSLAVNLGVLGLFKYFDFFRDSLAALFASAGWEADWPTLNLVLPVGISFYTFQTLSYTIDVYRREMEPCRSFRDFALYVAFFPQLVAGPIERASRLLPQILAKRRPSREDRLDGIGLILTGYLKKVVIADQLAGLVQTGFSSPELPFPGLESWGVVLAFAFQIYGDFSGYSDIARGVARLLGFELVLNFARPYLVTNISDFWRHWHISLSSWLRDYLFIPLGGSRMGNRRTLINLTAVMFLGGLWHGAGWGFIIWGLYMGLLLVIHRVFLTIRSVRPGLDAFVQRPSMRAFSVMITFLAVCLGWLVFRAASIPDSEFQLEMVQRYLSGMFSLEWNGSFNAYWRGLGLLGGTCFLFQAGYKNLETLSRWRAGWQAGFAGAALLLILILGQSDGTDFIYFQF